MSRAASGANSTMPRHVGLILDGNRRWAKARGLPTLEGHRQGVEAFRAVIEKAFQDGVEFLSAYVFSTENWSRTKEEVSFLMALLLKVVERDLRRLHKDGIRVLVLGSRDKLDDNIKAAIAKTESLTANNTNGTLCLCFNYGGHQEIIDACKQAIEDGLQPADITKQALDARMYGGAEVPPLDVMIRTSGEQRTSGFMLWRSDYAELIFDDVLWPDFTPAHFEAAMTEFKRRQRRFGG